MIVALESRRSAGEPAAPRPRSTPQAQIATAGDAAFRYRHHTDLRTPDSRRNTSIPPQRCLWGVIPRASRSPGTKARWRAVGSRVDMASLRRDCAHERHRRCPIADGSIPSLKAQEGGLRQCKTALSADEHGHPVRSPIRLSAPASRRANRRRLLPRCAPCRMIPLRHRLTGIRAGRRPFAKLNSTRTRRPAEFNVQSIPQS